jgi:hypothetical protein
MSRPFWFVHSHFQGRWQPLSVKIKFPDGAELERAASVDKRWPASYWLTCDFYFHVEYWQSCEELRDERSGDYSF